MDILGFLLFVGVCNIVYSSTYFDRLFHLSQRFRHLPSGWAGISMLWWQTGAACLLAGLLNTTQSFLLALSVLYFVLGTSMFVCQFWVSNKPPGTPLAQ
jgi:hypothetical protein